MEAVWRDSLILAAMVILSAEFAALVGNVLGLTDFAAPLGTAVALAALDLLVVVFLGFVLYRIHGTDATPGARSKG